MLKKYILATFLLFITFIAFYFILTSFSPKEPPFSTRELSLVDTEWIWEQTIISENDIMRPLANNFVLTFDSEGRLSSTTDCNNTGGSYQVDGNKLSVGDMFSTLMYCGENTLEADYLFQLQNADSYFIENSELTIVSMDGITMYFSARD